MRWACISPAAAFQLELRGIINRGVHSLCSKRSGSMAKQQLVCYLILQHVVAAGKLLQLRCDLNGQLLDVQLAQGLEGACHVRQ